MRFEVREGEAFTETGAFFSSTPRPASPQLRASKAARRESAPLRAAVGRVDVAIVVQVQVVRVRSRVRRLSPPDPARATVVHRGTANVAGKEEIIRISTKTLINRHISLTPTRTTIG